MLCPLLCASFCDNNGNLARNHRFLLQTKRKATDKNIGTTFPEEIKGHMQTFGESEIKQRKAI